MRPPINTFGSDRIVLIVATRNGQESGAGGGDAA